MMEKNNLLINLPEDVFINNILLSKVLPNKSLLSLSCVCKYLRNLVTSHAFIKMHLNHSTTSTNHQLVLIKSTHRRDIFFSLKLNGDPCRPEVVEFVSPIERPKMWGTCNGLVCLSKLKSKNETICLWNPFTKEYKVLPPPLPLENVSDHDFSSITYGFGYDRLLDDYKIIRCSARFIYDDTDKSITEFQVYTLGTNTWRKISIDNNPYKSYYVISIDSIVFVNGALHWVMSTSNWLRSKSSEAEIVSFDIEKEVFREIQTPLMSKFKPDFDYHPVIQVLRGCLCVLELDSNSNKTSCNVWMMIDYGVKESWAKLFTILLTEVSRYLRSPAYYKLLRFCENGTEILMRSYNTLLVYDPIHKKARHVEFGEKISNWMYQGEIYIESLVSLNSGVYKNEKRIRSKKRRMSQLIRDFDGINLD